ncbi:MAG: SDR family oxidoreductase [Clostridiales bacterium]|nr:SDR family oxidoreductase [Clostridiales bacterium]
MSEKKTVVITDARSVSAKCAAEYLARQGYDVQIVPETICLWDEAALAAFAQPLAETLHGVIHPAPEKILGGIEQFSGDDWKRARDEGPMAAFCVTKVFCNIMREKRQGAIIYLNSIHAEKPVGEGMLFSMGCGAVQMLCREINQDYGEQGVNCFFVQKGIEEGEENCISNVSPIYCGVDQRYPTRKMPAQDHLNGLLAFLLTDAAAPLTGSDLRADGGLTMFYNHRKRTEGRRYVHDDD